jgi:hypothetical protein
MKWTKDDFIAVIAAITLAVMLPTAGAALALFLMPLNKALSHSFYDPECCSDKDCAPIDSKLVRITDSGYVVTVGPGQHPMVKHAPVSFVIPYHTARESPDGRYHVCITEQHVSPDGTAQFGASMLCFYRPPMSY